MKYKVEYVKEENEVEPVIKLRLNQLDGSVVVEAKDGTGTGLWKHIIYFRPDGRIVVDNFGYGKQMGFKIADYR